MLSFSATPITIALLAANVIISIIGFQNMAFFNKYKFNVGAILHGKEYLRMISSGFLHGSLFHLFANGLALYYFASALEFLLVQAYGPLGIPLYLLIYFASMLGGDFLALFFHRHNPHYSAIGASGALSGVSFALCLILPDATVYLFGILPLPFWIFSLLFVGYSLFGMGKNIDNVGHEAHLGGAVTGLVIMAALFPSATLENWWIFLLYFGLSIAGIAYLSRDSIQMIKIKHWFKRGGRTSFSSNSSQVSSKPKPDGLEINMRQRAQDELDKLLDKLNRKGQVGMTQDELRRMQELGDYLNRSGGSGGHRAPQN